MTTPLFPLAYELSRIQIAQLQYLSLALAIFCCFSLLMLELYWHDCRRDRKARTLVDDMIKSARMDFHLRWISHDTTEFVHLILNAGGARIDRRHLIWARIRVNKLTASVRVCYVPDLPKRHMSLVNLITQQFFEKRWNVEKWPSKDQPHYSETGIQEWDKDRLFEQY